MLDLHLMNRGFKMTNLTNILLMNDAEKEFKKQKTKKKSADQNL